MIMLHSSRAFFFFNDTATTEIYTLSLHDALPISRRAAARSGADDGAPLGERLPGGGGRRPAGGDPHQPRPPVRDRPGPDRKSTCLNSSHANISYAVFCLKKKKSTR